MNALPGPPLARWVTAVRVAVVYEYRCRRYAAPDCALDPQPWFCFVAFSILRAYAKVG